MTYIPTEEELEEMGFIDNTFIGDFKKFELSWGDEIQYSDISGWFISLDSRSASSEFYPQSRLDVETLIRLFTKPS